MAEQRTNPSSGRGSDDPIDRTRSDGEAGRGDMLGGTGAGVGDRLGPDQGVERGSVTIPMSGDEPGYEGQTVPATDAASQHDLDDDEGRTDADLNYHGMDSPA